MKKYLKWFLCLINFLIFIILSILVLTKNDIYIDSVVYDFVSKFIYQDLTNIIKILTNIGGVLVVIVITLITLIKNRKYGIYISINLIIITIFQLILKSLFSRTRPVDINLIEETGYSFPSGHSLTAMAFYGFIIYLIYISNINKRSKIIYISLFSICILIVGLSRIYLGVHFFTDVLGAFTFAFSYLVIYTSLLKRKRLL